MYASPAPPIYTPNQNATIRRAQTALPWRIIIDVLEMEWNGMVLAARHYSPLFGYYLFCWSIRLCVLMNFIRIWFVCTLCWFVGDKINCSIVAVHILAHTNTHKLHTLRPAIWASPKWLTIPVVGVRCLCKLPKQEEKKTLSPLVSSVIFYDLWGFIIKHGNHFTTFRKLEKGSYTSGQMHTQAQLPDTRNIEKYEHPMQSSVKWGSRVFESRLLCTLTA